MQNAITARYYRSIVGSMLLGLGALLSQGASATLMNADFSSGFDNWVGEIATFVRPAGPDSGLMPAGPTPETTYPANFILPGGSAAKLSTSTDGTTDNYFAGLSQIFPVDSIAGGSTLELSLTVTTMLTDIFNGGVQLIDNSAFGPLPTLDLTGGGSFDITAWAGRVATFAFAVNDFDFTLEEPTPRLDMITVSGITFTETAAVPEPGSLLLVGLGLVGLWGSRRRCVRSA